MKNYVSYFNAIRSTFAVVLKPGGSVSILRTLCCLLLAFTAFSLNAAEPQVLRNHVPPVTKSLTPVGRLTATNQVSLAFGLPLRNELALSNLLQQIYNPASPNYRHYLTPAQFTEQFGPTEQDYKAVIAFAAANHLRVTGTHPNRLLLDVSGTTAQVEQALHVALRTFNHPTDHRLFYAPDREPSLDLSVPVLHISGLDNCVLPRPLIHPMPAGNAGPRPSAGAGPGGAYMGKDFRAAYAPGVSLTGSGQSVGLLQFDSGFYQSDITAYETQAGLPNVPVQAVLLDGYGGGPGGGNDEVSLDIEMVISMAPGVSNILVFEGSATDDILNSMAASNQVKQLSASWSYPIDATTIEIFQEFAAQGQSFFNASGDYDAWVGAIYSPCDNPYITIVGGTTLAMTGSGAAYDSETVWNWGTEYGQDGIGSGGGISTEYSIPPWQTNISMTANQGSKTMRNIPDVAMTADNVWVRYGDGAAAPFGGTSCATPLWAGFAALVNQQAAQTAQASIGFINPALDAIGTGPNYALCFHDITTGNNTWSGSLGKFYAVAGYDLCTGWGTPTGQGLINALANPEALIILPNSGLAAVGGVGGPFFPVASEIFSLTNVGTNTLTWTLSNTSAWLSASSTSGSIAPGAPAALISISLNNTASNLALGTYQTTIWFTNQNDNVGQSRAFTLAIIPPPTITQQPANEAVLEGATATFSVQATGGLPLFYQWQLNGTNLVDGGEFLGSATTNLTISGVSGMDLGAYSVVVTNFAGGVVSSNATLTITPSGPVIITQPTNESVIAGKTATLFVGVIGTTPFSFQWTLNGTNLLGATNALLIVPDAQFSDAGTYAVLITNALGWVVSSNATLTVTPCDPLPAGIVAWWEGEGNGYDSIGSNNGTLVGAVTYTNGEVGQGFLLDGDQEMVTVGNSPSLQLQDFTIETWLRRTSTANVHSGGGNGVIFGYGTGGYALYLDQSGTPALTQIPNGHTQPAVSITDTQFHHLAVTKSGSTIVFYVDGVAYSAPALDLTFTFSTVAAIGGRGDDLDNGFLGVIDETSVYNRALSTNEIAAIYQAGSNGKCASPVPPIITDQPTNQTVQAGSTVTFAVTASGSLPLSYQWSFNSTNLPEATNAILTLANVQLTNAGSYSVSISNFYGTTNSSIATLTVFALPPTITSQPANETVYIGMTAQFTVGATGTSPLSYQWNFNNTNILNSTNATLTLQNVQLINAGNYSVSISNPYGATNSAIAALTVNPPPSCDPPPSGIVAWWAGEGNTYDSVGTNNGTLVGAVLYTNGEVGRAFAFDGSQEMVTVGNSPSLQLQDFTIEGWLKRSSTSNVHVGGGSGIIFGYGSGGYALYLDQYGTPALTQIDEGNTQPAVSITDTNFHHLAVTKSASTIVFYVDGIPYSAPDFDPTFTFSTIAAIGGRGDNLDNSFLGIIDEISIYNRALASNEVAAIYQAGSNGKCPLTASPMITDQPTNQTLEVGSTAIFTVAASGSSPLSYQWSFQGTNLVNATNATLTLPNVQLTNAGSYAVLITNLYGATNSAIAILTVNPPTPCDPLPSGIVGWWPGEGNAYNSVGTNNGTLVGAVTYTSGEVGQGFLLDGNQEMVTVGNSPSLQLQDFTIETWLRRTSTANVHSGGGNGVIFGYGTGGYALYLDQSGTPALTQIPNGNTQPAVSITDTQFHHLAVTKSGSKIVFYVDGVAYSAPAFNATFTFSTVAAIGGRGDDLDNGFLGVIDETSVYNRALSTNEIAAIYQAGSNGKCPAPPTIFVQPASVSVNTNVTVNFSVIASGTAPLMYQWSFDGSNLLNATNPILTLKNVGSADSGSYSVLIANSGGTTNSTNAMLTVKAAPVINIQPLDQTVGAGDTASFSVIAAGTPPLSYQWRFNGTNIIGATNSGFALADAQLANEGYYSVTVTNLYGSAASSNAQLIVQAPPIITTNPTNLTVNVGDSAIFVGIAAGSSPLSYQWTINGTNNPINGATNQIFVLSNVQLANAGTYTLTVTNLFGLAVSSGATLAVVDTLDHFTWNSIPSPRFVNAPFAVTIEAMDSINQVFTNFTGTVALTAPGKVNLGSSGAFFQGVWAGSLVIPQTASNLVLQASDDAGHAGLANPINVLAPPSLATAQAGSFLFIFWPIDPTGFSLEISTDLTSMQWIPVTAPPLQIGNQNLQAMPIGNTNQFYRLRYTLP